MNKDKNELPIIEEQGRALLQAVPDLVFLLDRDGTYVDIFSAADEDLFLPREQLIGRTVIEVLPAPVGDDCMRAISELTTPRDVSSFSYELQIEGRRRWFEGRVALCGEKTVIVLVRDFTEQRTAETRLREANTALHRRTRQLQQLEHELSRVEQRERRRMAQLLHDNLQQLLVGAKFNLSLLANRLATDGDRDITKMVTEIIDKVLDQSRSLTAELYPTVLYEGSLNQSLNWIKTHVAHLHGLEVEVTIEVHSDLQLPESVRFTMFNSVLELLLNVTKHSGVKKASIIVSTSSDDQVKLAVSDEGKGFLPSVLDQTEDNMASFGLFALNERISWLGGEVEIQSRPGAGCTVTLSLPVEPDDENSDYATNSSMISARKLKPLNASPRRQNNSEPIRVVIVDDHTIVREGLARILKQDAAFNVVGEAADGETGVALVPKLKPDVILMDVSMPGIGGAEATRLIKLASPQVKVIALSMHNESEQGLEMREAGAAEFINKSHAVSSITDTIKSCCDR